MKERLTERRLGAFLLLAIMIALPGVHWLATVASLAAIAVVACVRPEWMVAVVVLSIPVQSSITLPFVQGEITVTQLCLFGLMAGWGVVFWRRQIWLDAVVVGFLLVLAAYAVSFIAVDSPSLWFQESYRWAVAGVFYVICRSVVHSWQEVRMILWAVIVGVVGTSVVALLQLVTESGPSDFLAGGSLRVFASFGTPNTLAAYLEMTIPVLMACIPIAWFVHGEFKSATIERWLFVLVPALGMLVLLLTQSRGGTVGILAAMAVLWLHLPTRAKIPVALIASVALVGFLATAPGRSQLERFGRLNDEVNTTAEQEANRSSYDVGAGRGALWSTAQIMIADKPFTGVGAGEFDENYREYVPSWIDRFPRGQAHNVWLQMGAQAGIWGIAAYGWWFVASVWGVITARRRIHDPQRVWLLTGVLAVFAAYAVHSMVDYLNVLSLGLQLSVLTAIALNFAPQPLSRYSQQSSSAISNPAPEIATCHQ